MPVVPDKRPQRLESDPSGEPPGTGRLSRTLPEPWPSHEADRRLDHQDAWEADRRFHEFPDEWEPREADRLSEALGNLAALARDGHLTDPATILLVQADLLARARHRDPGTAAAFGALVDGLLPRVDPATAAAIARRVAPCPDLPEGVLDRLRARGAAAWVDEAPPRPVEATREAAVQPSWTPHRSTTTPLPAPTTPAEPPAPAALAASPALQPDGVARLVALADDSVDLALARNPVAPLGGRAVAALAIRARERPALAEALLARPDLPAQEAAGLYLHASPNQKARLREALAAAPLPDGRGSVLPRPTPEAREALIQMANRGLVAAFGAGLAALLHLDPVPDWGFEAPERHDLLALSLLAAGFSEEEATRIILTLHPAIARSVETVFGLVGILRATPRSTALRLLEACLGREIRLPRGGRFQPHLAPGGTPARGSPSRSGRPLPAEVLRERRSW